MDFLVFLFLVSLPFVLTWAITKEAERRASKLMDELLAKTVFGKSDDDNL